jgi:hypothetical protein
MIARLADAVGPASSRSEISPATGATWDTNGSGAYGAGVPGVPKSHPPASGKPKPETTDSDR